jgi:hypothetical protein
VKRVGRNVDLLTEKVKGLTKTVKEESKIIKKIWESEKFGKNECSFLCGDSSDDDLFGPSRKCAAKKTRKSVLEDSDNDDKMEEESDVEENPKTYKKNPFIESECEQCLNSGEEDEESFDEEEPDEGGSSKVARKRKCIHDERMSEVNGTRNSAGNTTRSNTKGAKFRKNMKTIHDDDENDEEEDNENDNGREKDDSNDDDVNGSG